MDQADIICGVLVVILGYLCSLSTGLIGVGRKEKKKQNKEKRWQMKRAAEEFGARAGVWPILTLFSPTREHVHRLHVLLHCTLSS